MSEKSLVRQKTEKATGGNVNYYLIDLANAVYVPACIAEVEDVIEFLEMQFCEGNVFKALVRLTKLRQDLGKPGSSSTYEAEKIIYYFDRTVAQIERKIESYDGKVLRNSLPSKRFKIVDPKRLDPYEVHVDDLINALEPTHFERIALESILLSCLIRKNGGLPHDMLAEAMKGKLISREILAANQS